MPHYLRLFDPWKNPLCTCPPKYSLQPYTGCSHKCLYCYASSYIGYRDSLPKKDFIKKLLRDLRKADKNLPVSISNSSDPYPPMEKEIKLTRQALKLLLNLGFKVLIVTKSNLVLRDVDLLSSGNASISLTITTLNEALAKRMEPHAPPPSARLTAIKKLCEEGIPVSVRIDPIIPGINDDPAELEELVSRVADKGALHIVASTYKVKLDNLGRMSRAFPEKAVEWRKLYLKYGARIKGYWYLPERLRKRLLEPVLKQARKERISYAVCREGFRSKDFFNAPSCDGSHLIPLRIL
ncbi:MAG: radical SAM protein [Thermoprotei archaeon]|nr:MAG: radical SAM protein [Thermoprotei archaeon]